MKTIPGDVVYAIRQARKAPAFACVVVFLIGLGIAANAIIFTMVDALLLQKLPVRDPQELVRLIERHPPIPDSSSFDYGFLRLLQDHSSSFSRVIGKAESEVSMMVDGRTELVQVDLVTDDYFDVLGVQPSLGTLPGTSDSAILSDRFWRKRFNGDPAAIGSVISLNSLPFRVVGVTPSGFHGTTAELNPDLRVLSRAMAGLLDGEVIRGSYELIARLQPGVSIERARGEVSALATDWTREQSPHSNQQAGPGGGLSEFIQVEPVERGRSILRDQFSGALELLMGGAGLVFLMVCSNVAGLLLERAVARERDSAVRLAIGASRRRLMMLWLTESLVLSFAGGALGVGLAQLAVPVLSSAIPPLRNRFGDLLSLDPNFHLNWRVIVLSFAACAAAAVGAGLIPAWRAAQSDFSPLLRGARAVSGGPATKFESGITLLQIALCTLLLIEAALFGRTMQRMQTMDVGFDTGHVVTFTFQAAGLKGGDKSPIWEQLRQEALRLPGVRSASIAWKGLLRGTGAKATVGLPGTHPTEVDFLNASLNGVSPEYFETMGIRVVAGRGFVRSDRPQDGIQPTIVNQAFVRRFFPGVDPIGRLFGRGSSVIKPTERIVGVVSDSQYRGLREPVPPVYYHNVPDEGPILHIRSFGDPASLVAPLRQLLLSVAKGWSIREVNLLSDELARSMWRERLVAQLVTGFAIVAGLLAAVGLYGTLAYYVSRSRRSLGIRVAIGASRAAIVLMLMVRVGGLIVAGAVFGWLASVLLAGWVSSLLFGITPSDPLSVVSALTILVLTVLLAAVVPTVRALSIDPAITLREE